MLLSTISFLEHDHDHDGDGDGDSLDSPAVHYGPWLPYDLDVLRNASQGADPLETVGDGGVYDVYPLSQTFELHSKTDSDYTIYLDFDGHTTTGTSWNNASRPTFTSDPFTLDGDFAFSDTELSRIQRVWVRVAEDFAAFDVNVTTEEPSLDRLRRTGSNDEQYGVRVVISQDSDWLGSSPGGIAYLNSFRDSADEPAFVFTSSEKGIAEATSHEVGHSLGLSHDGKGSSSYYGGHGSGATSWGPIMGSGYGVQVTQWSRGEYDGATTTQDDLSIITNGFIPYREDDYGDTTSTAQPLQVELDGTLETGFGIIEQRNDLDVFSFVAGAGQARIDIDPIGFGANLDIQARLLNANGEELAIRNPTSALNAGFVFDLPVSGEYFLEIDGVGFGDPATNGYSDYASLGHYRITGDVPLISSLDVFGTAGDDALRLELGEQTLVVEVNGQRTSYSASVITSIQVDGLGGWDQLTIVGGVHDDVVAATPLGVTFSNVNLTVASNRIEAHRIEGGEGANSALAVGSDGDDQLAVDNSIRLFSEAVFELELLDFAEVGVNGGQGADSGVLHDTAAADTWTATMGSALLSSRLRSVAVDDFDELTVLADRGGWDTVRFQGGQLADVLRSQTRSQFAGSGRARRRPVVSLSGDRIRVEHRRRARRRRSRGAVRFTCVRHIPRLSRVGSLHGFRRLRHSGQRLRHGGSTSGNRRRGSGRTVWLRPSRRLHIRRRLRLTG